MIGNTSPSLFIARREEDRREHFPTGIHGMPRSRLTAEDAADWIGRHPALCMAAALTVGVMLGWFIKRR